MNNDRILELADLIENLPHTNMFADDGFCMSNWTHHCGTPSCIAGWAIAMERSDLSVILPRAGFQGFSPVTEAATYLGIGYSEACALFEPDDDGHSWSEITPSQAARTLRRLAVTGKVVWELDK